MSMSQRFMSPTLTGLPRCGAILSLFWAWAAPASKHPASRKKHKARALRIDMTHPPIGGDAPAGHRIEMMIAEGGDGRLAGKLAALGHKGGAGGLEIARIVPGAALQDRG